MKSVGTRKSPSFLYDTCPSAVSTGDEPGFQDQSLHPGFSSDDTPGGCSGLPGRTIQRHKLVCDPLEEGAHPPQGYTAGSVSMVSDSEQTPWVQC